MAARLADERLLDAIAHELRSSLTAICGLAETLAGPVGPRLPEADRQHLLERIAANGARMQATLANLVDAGRERDGVIRVARADTPLAELVSRVLDGLDLGQHPVESSVEVDVASVDPFLTERILENLVTNAVRHTPLQTAIQITVSADEGGVQLTVADDGPGVTDDIRPIIFDRFRRGSTSAPGAGLGLFLVKQFAELHGGHAWIDDGDGGASFRVTLPSSGGDGPVAVHDGDGAVGQFVTLADDLPVGVVVVDRDGRAVAVNQAWLELSGLDQTASMSAGWLAILEAAGHRALLRSIKRVAAGHGPVQSDHRIRTPTGSRWTRWWLHAGGTPGFVLVVMAVADVHADRVREDDLVRQATHDALTGLFNRTQFFEFAQQALRRLERDPGEVGVVFLDLDRFKEVNDVGGHALGDRVLEVVGERLAQAVRPTDVVARLGGDEFAVLCPHAEQGGAEVVMERIRTDLGRGIDVDGAHWPLDATLGMATTDDPRSTAEALLRDADQAMYRAKLRTHDGAPGEATGS